MLRRLRSVFAIVLLAVLAPAFANPFNLAPDCSGATASPASLWPPSHSMAPIEIAGVTDPEGEPVAIEIACILQDEPPNNIGDGNTEPDADGVGTSTAWVLQERAGNGNGRFYHIDFIATDPEGARCGGEVTVKVDKSRAKPAVDEGRLYPSVVTDQTCGQHAINNPPVIYTDPVLAGETERLYRYPVQAHDPDQDPLTYRLNTVPEGMAIDPNTGLIEWEIAPYQQGVHRVEVQVDDGRGGSDTQHFVIDVIRTNQPPLTAGQALATPENHALDLTLLASDPNQDPLTYHILSGPSNGNLSGTGAERIYLPDAYFKGTDSFTFFVDDGEFQSEPATVTIEVTGRGNHPPRILSEPITPHVLVPGSGEAEILDLRSWDIVILPNPDGHAQPNWTFTSGYTSATQTQNALASVLLGDFTFSNSYIEGQWRVNTTADDDFIGFVFGYQNTHQFYLFDWKRNSQQNNQSSAPRGMALRRFDYDPDSGRLELWSSMGARSGETLYRNDIPWRDRTTYDFALAFEPGKISITVQQGDKVLDSFTVYDDRFVDGRFGFYNYSQAQVHYSGFTSERLANRTYWYPVEAMDPDGDTIRFRLLEAPEGMTIDATSGTLRWETDQERLGQFPVTIEVADEQGATAEQAFQLVVTDDAPIIVSTPTESAYVDESYRYRVKAFDPNPNHTLTYSLIHGPSGMLLDPQSGAMEWRPGTNELGEHSVTIAVYNPLGHSDRQSYPLHVREREANSPPAFTSTPITEAVVGRPYSYVLSANDPDNDHLVYGFPNPVPYGMQMFDGKTVAWTPTADQLTEHSITVDVSDGRGSVAEQRFVITVRDLDGNQPPVILSSPAGPALAGMLYEYPVEATDPDGDTLTFHLALAPSGMSIDSNTGMVQWTPSLAQIAEHQVRIVVEDGKGTYSTQSFTLPVIDPNANRSPQITSVPERTAQAGTEYHYPIEATDPDGDPLSYQLTSAPMGMSVDESGRLTWLPVASGEFTVAIRVSDGQSGSEQLFTLQVSESPQLDVKLAIHPILVEQGEVVTLTVTPIGGNPPLTTSVYVNSDEVELDANGQAVVIAQGIGRYEVQVEVADDHERATAFGEFRVHDPNDTTPPTITLDLPEDQTLTAPLILTGSIDDDQLTDWTIKLYPAGESQPAQRIAEGSDPISGTLGTLDPSMLLNGYYDLIIKASDAGGRIQTEQRSLEITGNLKVGHFSVTFQDIEIPLGGLPIGITRSYDTRQKAQPLAFGQGWSIGYQGFRVSENRRTGLHWQINSYGGSFGQKCVESNGDRLVTLYLPDGREERFRAKAEPECSPIVATVDVHLVFEPLPGTHSQLEQLDYGLLRLINGNLYELGSGDIAVDPDRYRLTTPEGYAYEIDQHFGLQKLTEPDGHTLEFTAQGIISSRGIGLTFERDAQGRIDRILDPDGHHLTYDYDAQGDLIAFTDREGHVSSYRYDSAHTLIDLIDPRGDRALRNEYDPTGRLIAQIDAQGHRIDLTHDLDGRQEIIRDRNGHPTLYHYDDRGNVLTETNALGETITRTYDAEDNERSRTDPLGNTTYWEYDRRGNQLTETDPLGKLTRSAYTERNQLKESRDAYDRLIYQASYSPNDGKLLRLTDALGQTTQFEYQDPWGHLTHLTDAAGNQTHYGYNIKGWKTSATAPDGSTTRYHHDHQGRVLQETLEYTDPNGDLISRVTHYHYDRNGHLTQTTHPDRTTTRSEYNAIGKVTAEIDVQGRRTEHAYDNRGNLTETRYPDGTKETIQYDPNGNEIARTDRAGRITKRIYDAADRLIETLYPDATPETDDDNPRTKSEYDAAGRQTAIIDENGNRTEYEYDAAGRNTLVRDALGNETHYQYDANGNRIAVIDALGNKTQFLYDVAGQLTETVYPDQTPTDDSDNPRTTTHYDALGRRTAQSDESGRTTRFEYDPKGRLTAVIDALNQRTEYHYDPQGNQRTQSDAQGRTTQWRYDEMGRPIERILPLGQSESLTYTATGQLQSRTDFNGQTTHYTYETDSDRLATVSYPDGTQEQYSYTLNGLTQRITTTQSGTQSVESYAYDEQDRLTRHHQANGSILAYAYDPAGNRTQITLGGTEETRYTFDALNRLETVTDAQGNRAEYTYDDVGNRSAVLYPNGTRTDYTFDERNRLIHLTHRDGLNNALASYAYTLAPTGQRIQIREHNGRTTDYQYDELYRLTQEQVTDPLNGPYSAQYQYDPTGNRTYEIIDGVHTQYSYDPNDQLLQQGGTLYEWDANGNLIRETLDGQSTTYRYDAKDQLIESENSQGLTTYGYNPNGIRTTKTENGETITYTLDENRDYAQVIHQADGTTQTHFLHGDDLLSMTSGGETHYYHTDGLGSTRALTDAAGTITDQYHYDAFGNRLHAQGETDNDYLFAGEQYDAGLDQYYLRARYYDPNSGRFTQMDTWLGSNQDPVTLHKYLYANSDPVNHIDPTGNFSMASMGAAQSIRGVLSNLQIDVGFSLMDAAFDPDNAGNDLMMGLAAMGGPAAFRLLRIMSSKFRRACNSFTGDTLVATEYGPKAIEEIKIGDLVWAYNEKTGQKTLQQVVHLIRREGQEHIVDITLESGEVIRATEGHPFYVQGEGWEWLAAGDLSVGDQLFAFQAATPVIASLDEELIEDLPVYNLTVEGAHTYFVGVEGVLGHNVNPNKPCRMPEIPGSAATLSNARHKARQLAQLGGDEIPYLATKPSRTAGKVYSGMQSPDGKRGWRMDFDSEKGLHINWWRTEEGVSWKGYVSIPGKTQDDYWELLRHFPWKSNW